MPCAGILASITGTTAPDTIRITTNPGSTCPTPNVSVNNASLTKTAADDTPNVTRVRMSVTAAGTDIRVRRHVTAVNGTRIVTNTRETFVSRDFFSSSE